MVSLQLPHCHIDSFKAILDKKTLVQTRKRTIYGLGSVQFKKRCPSESVPATLKRSLDMEMRVCGLETPHLGSQV
ncbi:hypothetical protein YC2023_107520 [Brassica napus]